MSGRYYEDQWPDRDAIKRKTLPLDEQFQTSSRHLAKKKSRQDRSESPFDQYLDLSQDKKHKKKKKKDERSKTGERPAKRKVVNTLRLPSPEDISDEEFPDLSYPGPSNYKKDRKANKVKSSSGDYQRIVKNDKYESVDYKKKGQTIETFGKRDKNHGAEFDKGYSKKDRNLEDYSSRKEHSFEGFDKGYSKKDRNLDDYSNKREKNYEDFDKGYSKKDRSFESFGKRDKNFSDFDKDYNKKDRLYTDMDPYENHRTFDRNDRHSLSIKEESRSPKKFNKFNSSKYESPNGKSSKHFSPGTSRAFDDFESPNFSRQNDRHFEKVARGPHRDEIPFKEDRQYRDDRIYKDDRPIRDQRHHSNDNRQYPRHNSREDTRLIPKEDRHHSREETRTVPREDRQYRDDRIYKDDRPIRDQRHHSNDNRQYPRHNSREETRLIPKEVRHHSREETRPVPREDRHFKDVRPSTSSYDRDRYRSESRNRDVSSRDKPRDRDRESRSHSHRRDRSQQPVDEDLTRERHDAIKDRDQFWKKGNVLAPNEAIIYPGKDENEVKIEPVQEDSNSKSAITNENDDSNNFDDFYELPEAIAARNKYLEQLKSGKMDDDDDEIEEGEENENSNQYEELSNNEDSSDVIVNSNITEGSAQEPTTETPRQPLTVEYVQSKCKVQVVDKKFLSHLAQMHPTSALHELCTRLEWAPPILASSFEFGPPLGRMYIFKAVVNGQTYQPTVAVDNRKDAKANAAWYALQEMGFIKKDISDPL